MKPSFARTLAFSLVGLAVIAVLGSRMVTCVPAGHVGVMIALGQVKEASLPEGVHLKGPHVNVMNISVQNRSYSVGFNASDPNAAVSSDMQTVGFQVNIGWYASPEQAWELVRYVNQNSSSWVSAVIDPAMRQGVKAVFSRYTLREIIQHREQVRNEIAIEIQDLVGERLDERHEGLGSSVRITQVTLDNIDYSDQFEQVIEATQREEQRARLAENELRRVEIEAQQQVVQAQAERQAAVERARGEAEALLIRNEAEVVAYLALRQAGFDLNAYRFVEQWDGVLPSVLSGDEGLAMMFQRRADGTLDQEQVGLIIGQLRDAREALAAEAEQTEPAP